MKLAQIVQFFNADESGVDGNENAAIDGDTGRYILPSRITRGIPAKRYSPERIRKSRYSMAI